MWTPFLAGKTVLKGLLFLGSISVKRLELWTTAKGFLFLTKGHHFSLANQIYLGSQIWGEDRMDRSGAQKVYDQQSESFDYHVLWKQGLITCWKQKTVFFEGWTGWWNWSKGLITYETGWWTGTFSWSQPASATVRITDLRKVGLYQFDPGIGSSSIIFGVKIPKTFEDKQVSDQVHSLYSSTYSGWIIMISAFKFGCQAMFGIPETISSRLITKHPGSPEDLPGTDWF